MGVRGKVTAKNPYGDDRGFAVPSNRHRVPQTKHSVSTHRVPAPKHFIKLMMDDSGCLQTECSSPEMVYYGDHIITPDLMDKFRLACQSIDTGVNNTLHLGKLQTSIPATSSSKRSSKKRRKSQVEDEDASESTASDSLLAHQSSGKMMSIIVSDREAIRQYYQTCLRAYQQINCRTTCKLWIKLIHPKKQVSHPYNGTIKDSKHGNIKDPERTKPEWWEPTTRHKEPDHLRKDERINLMVHLIEQCGRDDNKFQDDITVDQLFEEVEKKKLDLNGGPNNDQMGRLKLIRDICDLRTAQLRWEEGGLDDNTEIPVESHEEHAKKAEKDEASQEARLEQKTRDGKLPVVFEAMDLTEEPSLLTPTSSTTSPGVYSHRYALNDRDAHIRAQQCQATLSPSSPQSMGSYQSVAGSSPFHDLHSMHHQMVFSQQPQFNTASMEQAPEQMAAMGGGFVSMERSDSISPWTAHLPPTTTAFLNHVNQFTNEPTNSSQMHGMPLEQVSYTNPQYHGQSQDDVAAMSCFQPINQMNPRQMPYEPWRYSGVM